MNLEQAIRLRNKKVNLIWTTDERDGCFIEDVIILPEEIKQFNFYFDLHKSSELTESIVKRIKELQMHFVNDEKIKYFDNKKSYRVIKVYRQDGCITPYGEVYQDED